MKLTSIILSVILLSATVVMVLAPSSDAMINGVGFADAVINDNAEEADKIATTTFQAPLHYDRNTETLLFEWEYEKRAPYSGNWWSTNDCKIILYVDEIIYETVKDPNGPRGYIIINVAPYTKNVDVNVVKVNCTDKQIKIDVSKYGNIDSKLFWMELKGQGELYDYPIVYDGCIGFASESVVVSRLYVVPDDRATPENRSMGHYNAYKNTPTENYRFEIYENFKLTGKIIPLPIKTNDSLSTPLITEEQFKENYPDYDACVKVDDPAINKTMVLNSQHINKLDRYVNSYQNSIKFHERNLVHEESKLEMAIADNDIKAIERINAKIDSINTLKYIIEITSEFIQENIEKYSIPR